MKCFTVLEQFPRSLPMPMVTIGNFDGVHRGHRQILKRVLEEARAAQGCSVVITFEPHPLQILLPASAPRLIMTTAQKLRALEGYHIDYVLVLPFDEDVARWSPRQFVERVLVEGVGARKVFVGSNFVFGYQQRGTVDTLQELGEKLGFSVEGFPQYTWRRTRISSTLIRGFILKGQITEANRLLGGFFTLEGAVVHGAGRGRKLTVPTLNLLPENELIPKNGVYITSTSFHGEVFPSITNVGTRPTFAETTLSIETYLLGVKKVEAPEALSLAFHQRLRDEKRFETPGDLKMQIEQDVQAAKHYFERLRKFVVFSNPGGLEN
jgi:riboflavin kinase/FMN adenylyltransferase